MRVALWLPLLGLFSTGALPFAWHAQARRAELTAQRTIVELRTAQERFRAGVGQGRYAIALDSLLSACAGVLPVPSASLADSADAAYQFELRPARGATLGPRDCAGRETAEGYFVSAAPRPRGSSLSNMPLRAFAARSGGAIYTLFDGVAPRESDIDHGLAVPVEQLDTFKIP